MESSSFPNNNTSTVMSLYTSAATPAATSPVEEVALVVPETDDPTLPVMTFRAWLLGMTSCTLLIFLNTFFAYRTQPLNISTVVVQVAALPLGKLMAAMLPEKRVTVWGRWSFSLNPGPFNIKEHVIITIMATGGVNGNGVDDHPMGIITVLKAYYKVSLSFFCAFLIVISTQILGYGWAGMLRKYLVDPVDMWWPSAVAQVSLFRALHEKEGKSKGMTRMQFFLVFMASSFAYYTFPGYLFPMLTFFSWACWVWPHSITAHQLGSGYHGLGVGTFTLDWAGISAYHGNPLVTPFATILNIAFGFLLFIYIIIPLLYWKFNAFDARTFPIFSSQLFHANGLKYDIDKLLTPAFELDHSAYKKYGKLYISPLFALSIGSGFARITSVISHVALFYGSNIWMQSRTAGENMKLDIHARLMKSYKQVPMKWYILIFIICSIPLPLLMSIFWKEQVRLPWWGMIFAFALASLVALPIGVIQATTNQQPGYNVVAQFIIGYLLPGKPIANMFFKIYGHTTVMHSLSFLVDLKLGHYMKIPPRAMFMAQLAGAAISGIVNLLLGWWMLQSIENICDVKALHPESPWTCPRFRVMFDNSVVWGLIGPEKLFGPEGEYRHLMWLFVVGALLPVPVWMLSRMFPEKKWIPLINIPVISSGFAAMPPATPTNIASWIVTGIVFNYFVFKYRRGWWQRYNYVLSAALDAGTAFMGVFLFFSLQNEGVVLEWWGSKLDHCPLASCPTAPGVAVEGCSVFS